MCAPLPAPFRHLAVPEVGVLLADVECLRLLCTLNSCFRPVRCSLNPVHEADFVPFNSLMPCRASTQIGTKFPLALGGGRGEQGVPQGTEGKTGPWGPAGKAVGTNSSGLGNLCQLVSSTFGSGRSWALLKASAVAVDQQAPGWAPSPFVFVLLVHHFCLLGSQ